MNVLDRNMEMSIKILLILGKKRKEIDKMTPKEMSDFISNFEMDKMTIRQMCLLNALYKKRPLLVKLKEFLCLK